MFGLLETVLRLALLDPVAASWMGATLAGQPDLAPELLVICERESHCRLIGPHTVDQSTGETMRRRAMNVGWLDPDCVFHHGAAHRFSTRGLYGMSAAYSLHHIGGCLPPEVLDIPVVSAYVASRRAQSMCRRHGACDPASRRHHWAGAGKSKQTHDPA